MVSFMTSSFVSVARRYGARLGRALVASLLACGLVGAGLLGGASPTHADEIGISGQPAGVDGALDGRTRFSYTADPGQQISDAYLVSNTGSTQQTFTVFATDAFNDDNGEFTLLDTDQEPTDLGTWVAFADGSRKQQFDLAPGEQRLVPFTISVPAQATPGDHAGGLLSSVVTPGSQVTLDRRVGTRVYVRVSGDLQPALNIAGVEASHVGPWWNPFAGSVRLRYTVKNTGNIALATNVSTEATTWFGRPIGEESGGGVTELLPGSSRVVETEIPGVGQVGYAIAQIRLNPFVEGPDTDKQIPIAAITRNAFVFAPPWTVLIVIALVALAFGYRMWRRRRDAKATEEWVAYTEKEAERKAAERVEGQGEGADER